jgi:hypothetical protein
MMVVAVVLKQNHVQQLIHTGMISGGLGDTNDLLKTADEHKDRLIDRKTHIDVIDSVSNKDSLTEK